MTNIKELGTQERIAIAGSTIQHVQEAVAKAKKFNGYDSESVAQILWLSLVALVGEREALRIAGRI